jgi:hypothetical protein
LLLLMVMALLHEPLLLLLLLLLLLWDTHLAVWDIFSGLTKRPQSLLSLCALLCGLQETVQDAEPHASTDIRCIVPAAGDMCAATL